MIDYETKKDNFIQVFTHDLKNPLTAVIGSIDIIREGFLGPVNAEQEEYLQSAIESCHEVVMMIDNLLDVKKFETGKIKMAIHPYNAYELISKITTKFASSAKHDGIEFSADLDTGTAEIAVDSNVFTRILGNLLGNALKFTPEEGHISVSSSSLSREDLPGQKIPLYAPMQPGFLVQDRFVKVVISDNGNGLQADELESIFDGHTQCTPKTGRQRGAAGLGLAYCKRAVDRLHGMIWAESENGLGNRFTILLPCC